MMEENIMKWIIDNNIKEIKKGDWGNCFCCMNLVDVPKDVKDNLTFLGFHFKRKWCMYRGDFVILPLVPGAGNCKGFVKKCALCDDKDCEYSKKI